MSKGYSLRKRVRCICPRCEKEYTRVLFWTGNGIPKKICPECKEKTSEIEDIIYYGSPYKRTTVKTSQIDYIEEDPLEIMMTTE